MKYHIIDKKIYQLVNKLMKKQMHECIGQYSSY